MVDAEKKVALVTGAGRGIGRAIALALARDGHVVALAARTRAQLDEVAAECRRAGAPAAEAHALDLADGAAIDVLAETLLARHGAVDVLVNNAGIADPGHALEGDPDAWARMMAVNALAPMRLVRRLAPKMVERERGTIVNVASISAIEGMKFFGAYAASKFALRGWSLSTYERLREHGIKTVVIEPGFVATDAARALPGLRFDRMMTPDDVAAAAMLAVTTSPACCPVEITLRLTRRADA